MASKFKPLLIAIQNKVMTDIPDSAGTPGIRQADPDFGQIDIEGVRPAVAFPWLGIKFVETNYDQLQMRQQRAKMRIAFRLAFDPFSSASSLAPEDARNKALACFDIENKFYTVFQDLKFEYQTGMFYLATGLRRISAVVEERKDTLFVLRLVYEATFVDNSLNE